MRLSTNKFEAWTRPMGVHKAETFSFDNENERDKLFQELTKNKSVGLVKKRNMRKEFWVTAHYLNKEETPESRGFRFFGE